MRNRTRAACVALTAACSLALAVGSASANRLSYSSQGFRIIWTSLTFSESGGNFPISCPVTLEGSFNSATFTKVRDATSGSITRAVVNNVGCSEGQATILSETLPWSVKYQSFSGTLPSILSVRYNLIGAAFQIEPGLGVVCLARSSELFPAAGEASRESRGNITSLTPDAALAIPVTGTACPRAGIFSGSGEVFVQGSSERRVRLTLI
jgi:hypothetical protein